MSRIHGRLEITVFEGRELHKEDLGKMDPYLKLELHHESFKTKIHHKGGQTPKWDQTFLFNLKEVDHNEVLHIQCFDHDLLRDDAIGRADIPLSTLAQHTDVKEGHWFQLVHFDNFKKIAGYIRMAVTFQGSGWPSLEKKIEREIIREIVTPHHQQQQQIISPPQQQIYSPPIQQQVYSPPIQQQVYSPPIQQQIYSPPIQQQPVYTQPTLGQEIKQDIKQEIRSEGDHTLRNGARLDHHGRITSRNGRFHAIMQVDGNFVVYEGHRALWASNTENRGGHYVIVQRDHNLVVYNRENTPLWASNTSGRGSDRAHLTMQDDGNLVLYDGSTPLWSSQNSTVKVEVQMGGGMSSGMGDGMSSGMGGGMSSGMGEVQTGGLLEGRLGGRHHQGGHQHGHRDTLEKGGRLNASEELRSSDGRYRAVMQQDGNFVVYGGSALWATSTSGHAHWVTLQSDHNLVVYDHHNHPKWASNTAGHGHGHARLVMQNDGNLVVYDGHNKPLWASNTNGRY